MLSPTQVNDIFNVQLGRDATPDEQSKYSNASFSDLAGLKSNPDVNTAPPNPAPTPSPFSPTDPYSYPSVQAAAQQQADTQAAILQNEGFQSAIPGAVQTDVAKSGGVVDMSHLSGEIKSAQAPIIENIKSLKSVLPLASKNYQTVLSTAKQAITAAKQDANAVQRSALSNASKIITQLNNGTLDIKNLDQNQLNQIEADSGLPSGFFKNILQKAVTAQGGKFDPNTGKWIIPPKAPAVKKPTTGDAISSMQSTIDNGWRPDGTQKPYLGSDGYMSPSDYKMLKKEWVSKGHSAASFDSNFKMYTNPAYPTDYGFKATQTQSVMQQLQAYPTP